MAKVLQCFIFKYLLNFSDDISTIPINSVEKPFFLTDHLKILAPFPLHLIVFKKN